MNKITFLNLIATALEVEVSHISMDTKINDLPEWDSLGHLTIMSSIDSITNEKASEINDFGTLTSVSDIWDALVNANLAA
jgi:acyl carrier protein